KLLLDLRPAGRISETQGVRLGSTPARALVQRRGKDGPHSARLHPRPVATHHGKLLRSAASMVRRKQSEIARSIAREHSQTIGRVRDQQYRRGGAGQYKGATSLNAPKIRFV